VFVAARFRKLEVSTGLGYYLRGLRPALQN
jgi:hypothetical protein